MKNVKLQAINCTVPNNMGLDRNMAPNPRLVRNMVSGAVNVRPLSEGTRHSCCGERRKPDRRVSSDRAVSREPRAIAVDAAGMDFECCFGTSVPSFCGTLHRAGVGTCEARK